VRIEVLKALAKIVNDNTDQSFNAFILQYITRPMLKITIKKDDVVTFSRAFGYTEAIDYVKASYPITEQDLFNAYSKAGNMKNLEHKFVLLKACDFSDRIPEAERARGNKRPKK